MQPSIDDKIKKTINHQSKDSELTHLGLSSKISKLYPHLLQIIQNHSISSIVDIGCGNSLVLKELSVLFPKIKFTGVDFDEIINRVPEKDSYENISWISTQSYYGSSTSYDITLMISCFHEFLSYFSSDEVDNYSNTIKEKTTHFILIHDFFNDDNLKKIKFNKKLLSFIKTHPLYPQYLQKITKGHSSYLSIYENLGSIESNSLYIYSNYHTLSEQVNTLNFNNERELNENYSLVTPSTIHRYFLQDKFFKIENQFPYFDVSYNLHLSIHYTFKDKLMEKFFKIHCFVPPRKAIIILKNTDIL